MINNLLNSCVKGFLVGLSFGIGLVATVAIGVTVSTTFTTGDTLTAASLNVLKTAVESIPGWTKGTTDTDAVYTDGKVGIGTTEPGAVLDVRNSGTEDILNLYDGSTEVLTVTDGGKVNIGADPYDFGIDVTLTVKDSITAIGDDNYAGYFGFSYSDSKFPLLFGGRARGTRDSPQAIQQDDMLLFIASNAYDGSGFSDGGAFIAFRAEENFNTTSNGTNIRFLTSGLGQVPPAERMRIMADGNIGIGTTSPSVLLDVDGKTGRGVIEIDGDSGGCIKLQDTDNAGFTYCTALDGTLTCSSTSCE